MFNAKLRNFGNLISSGIFDFKTSFVANCWNHTHSLNHFPPTKISHSQKSWKMDHFVIWHSYVNTRVWGVKNWKYLDDRSGKCSTENLFFWHIQMEFMLLCSEVGGLYSLSCSTNTFVRCLALGSVQSLWAVIVEYLHLRNRFLSYLLPGKIFMKAQR